MSSGARGGRAPDRRLEGGWRYPYAEVGAVGASGLLTSQLNFQENKQLQEKLDVQVAKNRSVVMPGSDQQYGRRGSGIFGEEVDVVGVAPVARTQGVLTIVPASGAVMRGNTFDVDPMSALDGIEDVSIQGERVLAHDNQLLRLGAFRNPAQFE
jgi:hypothetical protein